MLSQVPPLLPYLDTPVHAGNACSHASMHHQLFKHEHTVLLIRQLLCVRTNCGILNWTPRKM